VKADPSSLVVLSPVVAAPIGAAAPFAITAENATALAAVMIQYRDLILHLRLSAARSRLKSVLTWR
jgi:hypothetical protein